MLEFRDLFNKLTWINKGKMEESLKGCKPSEVHCIEFIEKIRTPMSQSSQSPCI